MRLICRLVLLLPALLGASMAICLPPPETGGRAPLTGEWEVQQTPNRVFAFFGHDDDGGLIVMCDKEAIFAKISISFVEPRANWKPGESITVTTRSDVPMPWASGDGRQPDPLTGVVIGPTQLVIRENEKMPPQNDSNWDFLIMVMELAKDSFTVSAGGYTRTFPTTDLRKAVEPVLQACKYTWEMFVGGGSTVLPPPPEPPSPSQLPAKKFLLLVTWLTPGQPTTNYQVTFDSLESCQAARLQVINDAERMRKERIDTAPHPYFGLLSSMGISVSAVCVTQ